MASKQANQEGVYSDLRYMSIDKLIQELETYLEGKEKARLATPSKAKDESKDEKPFDVNLKVFFDEKSSQHKEIYDNHDPALNELQQKLNLRGANRNSFIWFGFIGYHIVKSLLWRRGKYVWFWKRQRFMSFPLLYLAMVLNIEKVKWDHKRAGITEYGMKRSRYIIHRNKIEKLIREIEKERGLPSPDNPFIEGKMNDRLKAL